MIFYLGEIVKDAVKENFRMAKNKLRSWEYGYCEEIDTVIISKDGTLGEIYDFDGLKIGLPEKPKDDKNIINHEKPDFKQKWEREEMPKGLNEETMKEKRFDSFIDEQYEKREKGIWIYLNGKPVYVPGTYWFGLQWCRENSTYPAFRIIQNELMIFWEACKADSRCYGMDYVKNRRFGASLLAIIEQLDSGTIYEDKLLGIVSKKGDDSKKIFRRLVKIFLRLPCFFRPVWSGNNMPKTELVLEEPNKRKKAGEKISEGSGLGTIINWHTTDLNAMDGDEIFRSLLDESGKYPREVPIDDYWSIVKTSHRKGSNIVGKCMMVSTVNSAKKGGAEFKNVWDDSNLETRNANNQTISGLYPIFIPAEYGMEGFYDEYGFSIIDDPGKKGVRNDLGKIIKIGSIQYLENEGEALKHDPEKFNEFKRQFPRNIKDAFRDESTDCDFNVVKLQEQIDHNEYNLDEDWGKKKEFVGNNMLERGNFRWKNGVKDTEVVWYPDPENGRFYIRKDCHPPREYRNSWEEIKRNGVHAKAPLAGHIGSGGIDPYNRGKNADGRGSKGSYHLNTTYHTCDELPNNTCIVEYIARPKNIKIFFEDMIMVSVYYSIPFLCEQSNDEFLRFVKDRGYRHYSMNNPFKLYKDLTPTEKDLGGAPQQDTKIGEAQFTATEYFVDEFLGVARDDNNRKEGEIGDFPFSRTLYQLKEVDTTNRTKYDAYISFSLSLLGNQKRSQKKKKKRKPRINPLQSFDNTGSHSKISA